MLFKNSVRTSKRTPHFTITRINWLTLFKFNWDLCSNVLIGTYILQRRYKKCTPFQSSKENVINTDTSIIQWLIQVMKMGWNETTSLLWRTRGRMTSIIIISPLHYHLNRVSWASPRFWKQLHACVLLSCAFICIIIIFLCPDFRLVSPRVHDFRKSTSS
jgi:hypothetical protein